MMMTVLLVEISTQNLDWNLGKANLSEQSETESAVTSFQIRSLVLGSQVFHFHFHVSAETERLCCFFVGQDLELLALTIADSEAAVKLRVDLVVCAAVRQERSGISTVSFCGQQFHWTMTCLCRGRLVKTNKSSC